MADPEPARGKLVPGLSKSIIFLCLQFLHDDVSFFYENFITWVKKSSATSLDSDPMESMWIYQAFFKGISAFPDLIKIDAW